MPNELVKPGPERDWAPAAMLKPTAVAAAKINFRARYILITGNDIRIVLCFESYLMRQKWVM